MATCANEQSTEKRMVDNQNAWIHTDACQDEEEEYEEDEDEDVDFNPFLKETPSPEASSSLSSEIEGLDGDVIDNKTITYDSAGIHLTSKVQNNDAGNPKRGAEGILMQSNVSSERACEKELQKTFHGKQKRRKSDSVSLSEYDYPREKENGSSSGIDTSDAPEGKLSVTTQSEPLINLDDEDAICRRTRARYSLASFTLDELEAFLQETDDEDDLQNVDDEEEYRKFLAAVLQGSNCDGQSTQENENSDDEDEDNDADFEIELEEALESDYDEGTTGKARAGQHEKARRRPETRRNRQQKTFAQSKNKLLAQAKRPLRPLVPILPNGPIAPIPARDWRTLMPETAPTREDGLINGFTPRQIGQLYCLIHEHVQLLIQIYSLCVLDPSRQHIASQLQRLIFEMLQKCKDVIACRSGPHPGFCFHPPCICSSVANEVSQVLTAQCRSSRAAEGVDSPNVPMPTPQNSSPPDETNEHHSNRQVGTSQGVGDWMPFVSGRVLSVLDVAPLHLVGRYMDDVSTAVQEHRRHYVESGCDASYEKEPLFPLPYLPSLAQTNEVLRVSIIPAANMVPSSSSQQQPKKTLAATLVESSKKQSVALVPKEIAKLAQRFFPLFNPSLFPHKPPPAAVASRVLFTDSEDELLALGLMEYNSDWKAIQQRFLPCKSKHQIFVRQKNRCSSKAPENPIKAVRRMKTSPLTAEEIACIQEGLRVFKLDWMSVWKFFVPHRDPSLLPRQWRIALGTQKSYKQDAAKKEKRRLYELKRRRSKAAQENWQLASDKEDYQAEFTGAANYSGDENTENAAEAYVHEAFLADWRPGMSDLISSERPCSNHREKDLPYAVPQREDTDNREQPGNYESREVQLPISNVHRLPYGLNNFQQPASHFNHGSESASIPLQRNYPVPGKTLSSSKSEIYLRPYRARRSNNPRLVRLAPDLPPVNLPPSVSVVSQSAFRSSQLGASTKSSIVEGGSGHTGRGNVVVQPPHAAKGVAAHSMIVRGGKSNPSKDRVMNSHQEESGVAKEKYVADERGSDSDLQMHPLLFEAPECGNLPFYPLSGTTSASGSFSFFSENRPQLNLNLCHNPSQANNVSDRLSKPPKTNESTVASGGIDFHPLLQRIDDVNGNLLTAFPSKGRSSQLHKPSDAVKTKSPFTCVSFGDGSKPSTANDRANGLDLEIHLSSASTKHKDINGDGTASPRGTVIVPSAANTSETRNIYSLSHQLAEISPAVCSQLDSGINGSVALSNNISRSNMDDIVDQSHLGIVMEQEELSDSDDEIEEHVEFECEEMDDSEGEEASGGEHIPEMQEKEVASPAHEKVGISVDSDEEQQELRNPTNSRGHISVPGKGNPPLLRLTLTGLGKDSASGSWLSLDPCAPGGPLCRKTKREDNASSKDLAVKNLVSCRSSRSSKRTTPSLKKVTVPKHAMDMAQQLSLGPLAVPTLKKPRKHICRANANLNVATTTSSRDERKDNFR